jgi:NTP pyrophosphatase (non-canonical NTP hydrolase)
MGNPQALTISDMFKYIKEYHGVLEYPRPKNIDEQMDMGRDTILALFAEVAELQESFGWKPWRPDNYKVPDKTNMKEEIVDIIFFLGGFMEIFGLDPDSIEEAFLRKLCENYDRINRGYNKKGGDK